jgi:hypothetical protein
MDSDAKGRELENAVHAIESVILQSSPTLHDKALTIEARKHITVGGVHHEVDIFVTVEVANGYTSTFIFECKNWEDAVGKNELIVFSEKIDATSAQRGFFVAKSFTKDAAAQAQKDPRITPLTATEHDPATTITPERFHVTAPASLTEFLDDWIKELYAERLLHFSTPHLTEGIRPMTTSGERSFGPGECILNDREIEHVQMDLECGVQIIHPVVLSHYEVSSRGRVIRLAPVKIHNVAIETAFVTTHKE